MAHGACSEAVASLVLLRQASCLQRDVAHPRAPRIQGSNTMAICSKQMPKKMTRPTCLSYVSCSLPTQQSQVCHDPHRLDLSACNSELFHATHLSITYRLPFDCEQRRVWCNLSLLYDAHCHHSSFDSLLSSVALSPSSHADLVTLTPSRRRFSAQITTAR